MAINTGNKDKKESHRLNSSQIKDVWGSHILKVKSSDNKDVGIITDILDNKIVGVSVMPNGMRHKYVIPTSIVNQNFSHNNVLLAIPYDKLRKYEVKEFSYREHFLWIGVCIVLIVALSIALFYALVETIDPSTVSSILPSNVSLVKFPNGTIITTSKFDPNILQFPSFPKIPIFVLLWGFIGSAVYVLKVLTGTISEKRYDNSYLPFHIARLFIGSALAAAAYFILITGSVFGLSIDFTKIDPTIIPYVYAIVAFMTGYFVRPIIKSMSNIVNALFNIETEREKGEK